jgi:hypothetical protein
MHQLQGPRFRLEVVLWSLTHCSKSRGILFQSIEIRTNDSQSNHNTQVTCSGNSLQQAVNDKTNVKQTDLTPSKPQHTEEADIWGECALRIDFMDGPERR